MLLTTAVAAFSLFSAATAQVVVQVGAEQTTQGGVFQFIPSTIVASNGTVVTFKFTGAPGNHTVTQSTLADPCNPVQGGFDSGFAFIPPGSNFSSPPEWNITITNDQKPIWFYCKQLLPSPHCGAGMVGAINANTTAFSTFQSNAKNFGSKPSGQGVGGLVGLGASASAGIGPVPSGVTLFGTPTATGPSPTGSGTTAPTKSAGAATNVVASSVFTLFAAILGITLA